MYTVKRKGEKSRLQSTCAGFDELASAENMATKYSRKGGEWRVLEERNGEWVVVASFRNGKRVAS